MRLSPSYPVARAAFLEAAQAAGDKFGSRPICSGPFKFVERVAQDRIVFERFDGYWNKAAIGFDKITYTPIVDATVRLANLKSGQFDFIERVASSDIEKLMTGADMALVDFSIEQLADVVVTSVSSIT